MVSGRENPRQAARLYAVYRLPGLRGDVQRGGGERVPGVCIELSGAKKPLHKGGLVIRYPRTILGTCCVPWNDDGTLAEGIFRDSIRILIEQGLPDLYLFGTAGEGYAVTESLFDRIVRIFVEEMADG